MMHTFLLISLIVLSVLIIVTVLMQEPKSAGLSGAISGGAEQLFGKSKARGVELILHRVTMVLSILFFVVAILIAKF
jgi:preprotein translocase subunit SecG